MRTPWSRPGSPELRQPALGVARQESPKWPPASEAFRGGISWGDLEETIGQSGEHRGELWDRVADKSKGDKPRILLPRNSHPEGGAPTRDSQED